MKLLFDENLSRKLVQRLADLVPESAHVVGVALMKSPDREIWDFAKANGFILVSTDLDFYDLANRRAAAESSLASTVDTPNG